MAIQDPTNRKNEKSMPQWLMPLLLLLLSAMGVWYFLRGSGSETNVVSTAPAPVPDSTSVAPDRESIRVKLADGTELSAFRGGVEDRLVACLSDNSCKPGKDLWFDFDNLNFETGSAGITPESQEQVNNIATILKSYPQVKIKIGGYTDKTGNAESNKKLSQERAEAVTKAIITAGANASQLEQPEGYGSEFAVVPAEASDEDRRIDRRISISLRAK